MDFKLKMLRQAQKLMNEFEDEDKKAEPNAMQLNHLMQKIKSSQERIVD